MRSSKANDDMLALIIQQELGISPMKQILLFLWPIVLARTLYTQSMSMKFQDLARSVSASQMLGVSFSCSSDLI